MIAATQRSSALALALLLWAGLSCDSVTAPPTTGGIRIVLVSETTGSTAALQANESSPSSDVHPIDAPTANVLLDAVRVTVTGPTTQTQTVSASTGGFFNVTITGLPPGVYTVTVEGLVGSQVAHYGQTSATVVAGSDSDANVTFSLFQPPVSNPTAVDTVEVLRFTVSWTAITTATSYLVDWSTSPTLASATSVAASGTSTEVVVPAEGQYYFAVRAVNSAVPSAGMRSAIKSAVVFQTVGNVNVLPATPSIVDGATQQFIAVARDLDNNVMSNVTLFWSSSNHAVATVSQSGLVTSVGQGQATITAIAKGRPGNAALTVTPQAASKLVFTTPPANTIAGQSIAAIKVAIQNPKNQVLTSDNTTQVTLAIAANPGSGTLAGTATATLVQGEATFNNLSINKSGVGYTLQATTAASGVASAASGQFDITAGAATQLAFAVQPTTTTAGEAFSPALQIEIRDALGNRVTSSRDAITISIDNDPLGGTLSGTKVVSAVDGIASFSGLSLDKAAPGYTLRASASGPIEVTSTAFTINPTTAFALSFGTQPANTSTDVTFVAGVSVVDRFGNIVSTAVPVTVSVSANPGMGTLTGTTTQTSSGGVATFNDLHIDKVGTGYTLTAQAGALTAATSNLFDRTVGAPAKLAFVTPPSGAEPAGPLNTIDVAVQDAHGNQTAAEVDVTLALSTNPGAATFGTPAVTSVGGVATFPGLSIDSIGVGYVMAATSGGLQTAESDAFDVVLDIAQFRTGGLHSCALTTLGTAYCWGWNAAASVGDGSATSSSRLKPSRVTGADKYFRISLGEAHACALKTTDSTAVCWGWNSDGQVGNGSTAFAVPAPTPVLAGLKFIAISAGTKHTCGITATDSLAFCWGQQSFGRLGNNQTATFAVTSPVAVNTTDKFSSISAGFEHTCAVRNDGAAYCWGNQLNGRLGNGVTGAASVGNPTAVVGGMTFLEISASNEFTCGVRAPDTDRRGYCWGANGNGQLGSASVETGTPTEVANSLKFSSIQAGGRTTDQFACGLTPARSVFCWGSQVDGRLGNGASAGSSTTPQQLLFSLPVLSLDVATAGAPPSGPGLSGHGCGLTASGLYCWGANAAPLVPPNGGMLGDGTIASSSVPVKVKGQR